jgi:cytoskeleton protein RodZ
MTESENPELQAAPAAEAAGSAIPGVGARLRQAREARTLSVDDVAVALKLGPRQVQALENGDWHGLPGQTFVRGFVRNYARLLQIDPLPLMEQLDASLDKPADSLSVPDSPPAKMPSSQPRRDRTMVFAGLAFVVLALLAYVLLPNDLSALRDSAQGLIDSLARKESAAPAVVSTPAAPAPAAASEPVFPPGATQEQVMNPQAQAPAELAPVPLTAPAPAPAAGGAVAGDAQLRFVFTSESWVEVRDRDNKLVFSQRGAAGSERSVEGAGPLSLVIGNAPGVKLYWRGQPVDLAPHTKGQVARLVLE